MRSSPEKKERHARMRIKVCVFMHAYEASRPVSVEEHGAKCGRAQGAGGEAAVSRPRCAGTGTEAHYGADEKWLLRPRDDPPGAGP